MEVPLRLGASLASGSAAAAQGHQGRTQVATGADLVDVQDTYLTIGDEQPRATAEVKVRVLSFENAIKLRSSSN